MPPATVRIRGLRLLERVITSGSEWKITSSTAACPSMLLCPARQPRRYQEECSPFRCGTCVAGTQGRVERSKLSCLSGSRSDGGFRTYNI